MNSKRSLVATALPLCLIFASACVNAPVGTPPTPLPPSSAAAAAVQSPVPTGGAVASASPAVSRAIVDVSPADQRIGTISVSLSFESPRHMLDQAAMFNASNVDPAQPTPSTPDGASKGAVVLSDMLHVTNNMDPSQALPPDAAQSIVRHAMVQVKSSDGAQPVPYLGVTMDVLLDGHPLSFGQPIVPMIATDASAPMLYYGNNVRLGQHGTYQVFIRVSRNALLGTDQPQAAQFNVLVH